MTSPRTRHIERTGLCGLVLFHILNAVLCIPITEFYPYSTNAFESSSLLAPGHEVFSPTIYPRTIWFYGAQVQSVIVSSF